MKVLFNTHVPFGMAHGGAQIQIEHTKTALDQIGVQTDWLRWWDDRQSGNILHHFGFLPLPLIRLAHNKGWKVAITLLLTETCNRSPWELLLRKLAIRTVLGAPLPGRLKAALPWQAYHE